MNATAERALVQLLSADAPLVAAVGDRITWDEIELDLPYPAVTLRLLATAVPGQLATDSFLRNPLVELAAHGQTSRQASETLDLAMAALAPYYTRHEVTVNGATSPPQIATFCSVRLTDVQQSRAFREGTYSKVAFYSIWLEE